jgi:hypothetical protein
LVTACRTLPPPARCADEPRGSALRETAPYRYQVTAGLAAEQLYVEVDLPPGSVRLQGVRLLSPFIHDVAVTAGKRRGFTNAKTDGDGAWLLPGCALRGCRARYRVALGSAARDLGDQNFALAYRGTFITPPSSWLLTPDRAPAGARYVLDVRTPPGVSFVTGTSLSARCTETYGGFVADLEDAPYAAFGPLSIKRVAMPGGSLDIAMTPGEPDLSRAAIERWVEEQADALTRYFGRFPIPHAAIVILLRGGRGVSNGRTTGNGGGSVILSLGERSTTADLALDWILVHELVHVSFPDVHQAWAEEGLATYLEPIIRARAGLLDPDSVWRDMILGLPQGQPQEGDRGLDHTDTWGRRYWGGALFWLLSDVEIRRQSGNERSLDDALRRIVALGGNISVSWSLDRALEEGDGAAGGTVLRDLRRRLGEAAVTVDLEALWKELGVQIVGGRIAYDDHAPLATVRRAITPRKPAGW